MIKNQSVSCPNIPLDSQEHTPKGMFLIQMARFLALLALAVSAFVYPLRFDARLLNATYDFFHRLPGGGHIFNSILPYIEFGFSPLTIKESLTAWAILPLVALWITWKLLFAPQGFRRFHPEFLFLILLLFWGLVSVNSAPQFGLDSSSTYTAFNFTVWIFFFLAISDLPFSRRYTRVAARWIVFIGLILMIVSTSEAVEELSRYIFRAFIRLDQYYLRNLYGGLIGHNTGVASICMGPFFFALGMLFHTRRWIVRIFLGLYVALSLYFFLVTQSRAVWILFLLLTPPFLLGLRRIIGTPIRLRHFAIGALLLVLFIGSQFAPFRWNFLHIEDAPFVSRLQSLTPRVLLTETRLRIFAASLPLVADKPMLGHGLSSFVSIYPKAQADYFSTYPDSILYPTPLLTEQAHNDYLQLLLETGLLGFGLASAAAFFFFRRALRRFQRLKSPGDRLLRYCAFFALGEILLHAFIDFPFHIAPLATFFLFYCALAYGNANEDAEDPSTAGAVMPEAGSVSSTTLRPAKVIILVVLFAVWSASIGGVVFSTKRLKADILFSRAMAMGNSLKRGQTAGYYIRPLGEVRDLLRQSLRVDPLDYNAQLNRGRYGAVLARIYADEALAAEAQGAPERARRAKTAALQIADDSLRQLYRAADIPQTRGGAEHLNLAGNIGPRTNHYLFEYIAQIWRVIADMVPPVRDEYMQNAFQFYQLSVRYSPTYSDAIVELIDFMGRERLGTPGQRRYYMAILAKHDRQAFLDTFMNRVIALGDQERYQAVETLLLDMREAVKVRPDYPEVYESLVFLYQATGNVAAHHQAVLDLKQKYPHHPSLPQRMIEDMILSRKFKEADQAISLLLKQKGFEPGPQFLITRAELLAELGRSVESAKIEADLLREVSIPSQFYASRAYVRRYLFGKQAAALQDYETALQYRPANLPTPAYLALIRDKVKQSDWKAARKYLALAREWNPVNEGLKRLEADLKQSSAATFLFP